MPNRKPSRAATWRTVASSSERRRQRAVVGVPDGWAPSPPCSPRRRCGCSRRNSRCCEACRPSPGRSIARGCECYGSVGHAGTTSLVRSTRPGSPRGSFGFPPPAHVICDLARRAHRGPEPLLLLVRRVPGRRARNSATPSSSRPARKEGVPRTFVMRSCPACFVAVPCAVRDHTDTDITFIDMVQGNTKTERRTTCPAVKAKIRQSPPPPPHRLGPGPTGTGGRISWTFKFSTSTRPAPIPWTRTSTTRESSRPSTSTR